MIAKLCVTPVIHELPRNGARLNVDDAIRLRRSVRTYTDRPVSDAVVDECLRLALLAPTGGMAQAWSFIVVREPDLRFRLAELVIDGGAEYFATVRPAADGVNARDHARWAASYAEEVLGTYVKVPAWIVAVRVPRNAFPPSHAEEERTADLVSLAFAMENLFIAARARGIGTVATVFHWFRDADFRALLNLPDDLDVPIITPFGYPTEFPTSLPPALKAIKRPWHSLVFDDRWETPHVRAPKKDAAAAPKASRPSADTGTAPAPASPPRPASAAPASPAPAPSRTAQNGSPATAPSPRAQGAAPANPSTASANGEAGTARRTPASTPADTPDARRDRPATPPSATPGDGRPAPSSTEAPPAPVAAASTAAEPTPSAAKHREAPPASPVADPASDTTGKGPRPVSTETRSTAETTAPAAADEATPSTENGAGRPDPAIADPQPAGHESVALSGPAVPLSASEVIAAARTELGLSRIEIAEIIGATPRLVDDWIEGTSEPGRHLTEQVEALRGVVTAIRDQMSTRAARVWLGIPAPELDYYTPMDVLRRGELYLIERTLRERPRDVALGIALRNDRGDRDDQDDA